MKARSDATAFMACDVEQGTALHGCFFMDEEKKGLGRSSDRHSSSEEDRIKAGVEAEFARQKEQFIREKVVKRKLPFHERLAAFLGRVLRAVLFGVVACMAFVWVKPIWEENLPPLDQLLPFLAKQEEVEIPRDDDPAMQDIPQTTGSTEWPGEDIWETVSLEPTETPGENPSPEQTEPEEGRESTFSPEDTLPESQEETEIDESTPGSSVIPDETETTEETEDPLALQIREAVEEMLTGYHLSQENSLELQDYLSKQVTDLNYSIVQISATSLAGAEPAPVPGIFWNATRSEFFFLFDYSRLQGSEFTITLQSGKSFGAVLKAADDITGLAVAVCDRKDAEANGLTEERAIVLGSSYSVHTGSRMICLGNPSGPVFSADTGMITYVSTSNLGIDTDLRLLYTNIPIAENSGGFLLSSEGKLVGVITSSSAGRAEGGRSAAIAISDLKDVMEKLANGDHLAYLGVEGTNITKSLSEEYELPIGLYVDRSLIGGPAYNSGIQNGDIITRINMHTISTMRELQLQLRNYSPGDEIDVVVQRRGREEYVEQHFTVTLGSR